MSNVKRGGKFRRARKKVCIFCVDKAESIDYKDVAKLKKYITEEFLELVLSIKDN